MVSKEELFAKYKELKAQGVTISLMELKKQLEGVNDATNSSATTQTAGYSGVGVNDATNSSATTQTAGYSGVGVNDATNSSATTQTAGYSGVGVNSATNSVAITQTVGYSGVGVNDATNSVAITQTAGYSGVGVNDATNSVAITQTAGYFSANSETQSNTWTTYTLNQASSPSAYSGNLSNVVQNENTSYANNFSGDFAFGSSSPAHAQSQLQSSIPQSQNVPYTGNVSQESVKPDEISVRKYCLIGYPLGHSLSEYIHNAGFKSLNMDATYEILETPPETLVDRIKYLKCNNYSGFNITIPLKLPITVFLDEIDKSAQIVGAVNTVVINSDKTMKGYNTDVIGFRNAIPSDFVLSGRVVGVLGTGGAARAAITALAQAQVKQIKIYTRNIPNSLKLLDFLRNEFPNTEFNAFQIERIRDLSDVEILVNTTPIGMLGRSADMTPVEENELKTLPQGALVYDVIYNPKKTILLKLAQKHGYRTINGVDMFIHQALAAEQIWIGRTPDFKDMKIAALENL